MSRSELLLSELCIYCLGSPDEFNAEHVIPRCSMKSISHAPTLHGLVCVQCNGSFSQLDGLLALPKLTASLLVLSGNRPARSDARHAGTDHYFYRVRSRSFPMLDGARCIVRSSGSDGYWIELDPRIAVLRHDAGGFDLIPVENVDRFVERETFAAQYRGDAVWLSLADETPAWSPKVSARLNIQPWSDGDRLRANAVIRDALQHRLNCAAAKIAFNFLAWLTTVKRYGQIALDLYGSSFDGIRTFIKSSAPNSDSNLVSATYPIATRLERRAHHVRVCTESQAAGIELIAYVTLFDMAQWKVRLGQIDPLDFPYDLAYEWNFDMGTCVRKRA